MVITKVDPIKLQEYDRQKSSCIMILMEYAYLSPFRKCKRIFKNLKLFYVDQYLLQIIVIYYTLKLA